MSGRHNCAVAPLSRRSALQCRHSDGQLPNGRDFQQQDWGTPAAHAPRTSPLPAPGVRPLPLAGTPGTALLPLSASGAGMPAAIELSRHTTDRLRYCSGAAPIATGAAVPHAGKSSARRCRCGGTARCGGPLRRARCCRPCSVPLLCLYGTCCVHGTITPWYTRWGVKAKISNTSFAAVVRDLQSTAKE
jgi:hypothetical protein